MSKARGLADLGNAYSDGALSNRNLIINGAMQVAQRGTSTAGVNSNGYYTVDRFITAPTTLGTWTVERSTDAPDGFASSFKMTCTTADASPVASANCSMAYRVEAQDLQLLGYGTPAAKDITISFWVKSNITGNATFEIQQKDNSDVQVTPQYSIVSANTWELKTIVVGGDAAGIINNDNDVGFILRWWMNSGSDFTGGTNQTVYTAPNTTDRNASNLGVGATVSDYFQITGVQLEVGDTATPFEHRSYGQELDLCKRYYTRIGSAFGVYPRFSSGFCYSASVHNSVIHFPVALRAQPTFTSSAASTLAVYHSGGSVSALSAIDFEAAGTTPTTSSINATSSGFTIGSAGNLIGNNTTSAYLAFDAEL
jgi:hypothetical protein